MLVTTPVLAQDDDDGGGFLERLIEDNLSGAGRSVQIRGFAGALSSRATLDELTIADDQGVWLTLRDAVLDWNRSALLRGRLEVTELTAGEILLPRLPASGDPKAPAPEATPFRLPDLPVSVVIEKVLAERVVLGEALFGAAAEVSLDGSVSLAGGAGEASIAIERIDGSEGALTLDAAYDNASGDLSVDLALSEGADGIAANLLDLPGRPSVALTVQGSGPLSDFTADIALATDGEDRLSGQVVLDAEGEGAAATRSFTADLGGDIAPVFAPQYRPFFGPDIRVNVAGRTVAAGGFILDRLRLKAAALTLDGRVVIGGNGLPELIDVTGEIVAPDGTPVLLPAGGDATRVDRIGLAVQFDARESADWTGDVTVEGLDLAQIDIARLALVGTGRIAEGNAGLKSVTADFDFEATGLEAQSPDVQQALGDSATGQAELRWSTGDPVVLDRLSLIGQSFDFEGSGQVATGAGGMLADLRAKLKARNLNAFSGLAQRELGGSAAVDLVVQVAPLDGSFDIEMTGTATDLRLDQPQADALLAGRTEIVLRADRDETGTRLSTLKLTNPALDLDASGDLSTGASALRADLRLIDAAVLDPALSGPVNLSATADQTGEDWRYDIQGDGVGATLDSTGSVTLRGDATPRITTETAAEISDLSLFAGISGRDLAGTADLRVAGSALADAMIADLSVDAVTRDIRTGDLRFDDLLTGRTDLSVRVRRNGATVTVPRLLLNATGSGVRAEGNLSAEGIGGAAPLLRADLALSANALERFSALAGRALGGALDAKVRGSARIDGSEVDVTFDATGRSVRSGMADVDPLLEGVVTLSGQVARDGDTVTFRDLDLSAAAPGLALKGSGRAEDILGAAPLVSLENTTLAVDDLSKFSALAKRPLGGAVDLSLDGTLRTDASVLDLVVDGQARSLTVGQANADRLLDGLTQLGLTVKRTGETIELPRFTLSNPQITAEADGRYLAGQSALRADIEIARLSDVELRMTGSARLSFFAEEVGEAWQVTLDAAAADATVKADARVQDVFTGNPKFEGTAQVNAADLSRFAPLAKRPLNGSLRADLSGSGQADLNRFDVSATVNGSNLRIGIAEVDRILGARTDLRFEASRAGAGQPVLVQGFEADTPTFTARASGQLLGRGSTLDFNARLADVGPYVAGFSGPVTVEGTVGESGGDYRLNVSGKGPGDIFLRLNGGIAPDFSRANLDVDGRAPLALANPFIAPRLLDGTLGIDLSVNGPLRLSSVSGRLSSTGARLVAPALNLVLEDIALTADLNRQRAQLDMRATKQAGGTVNLTGPIALTPGFNADLDIVLRGIVVEDPRLYRTSVDGTVTVDGPLTGGARIGGLLELGETELRIPSTGLGVTGPIPDGLVHVNEPAAVRATRERAGLIETSGNGGPGGGGPAYPLDLTIRAENRVFIRGRGLDAEMGGALTLRGTTAAIIPAGQFDLVRGRLDLLGKRLIMDEGRITLQGDFTPYIRLVARTDTGDVVVLIVIEGEALAPDIHFLSEPELPEEEVLARLLFGKSITSISPLQAAQLASAVATLVGKGGGGVVDNLRRGIGLDDLDITTDDEGNAGLRAGKYLSENLYTDVTVGSGGEAEINLNLDLSKSLTIRGGANNSGETSLGIFFERDY